MAELIDDLINVYSVPCMLILAFLAILVCILLSMELKLAFRFQTGYSAQSRLCKRWAFPLKM